MKIKNIFRLQHREDYQTHQRRESQGRTKDPGYGGSHQPMWDGQPNQAGRPPAAPPVPPPNPASAPTPPAGPPAPPQIPQGAPAPPPVCIP